MERQLADTDRETEEQEEEQEEEKKYRDTNVESKNIVMYVSLFEHSREADFLSISSHNEKDEMICE